MCRDDGVRLCEMEVWDGGEHVYCHARAAGRDAQGMWVCPDHKAVK